MDTLEPGKVKIKLERVLLNLAPPRTAHHLIVTRIGDDFTLEVGYIDPTEMSVAIEKSRTNPEVGMELQLLVFDRYTMNRENFERACKNMQDIKQGIAPALTEEDQA